MQNWMNRNVVATDALAAIRKVKLAPREYIVAAEVIALVDVQA